MAAAYLIIADTVLYCCGQRDHPIGDGRSDGHSEAQRHSEAHSSEPVLTLSPVWEKQVFWEMIFPCFGKRGKKVVKSPNPATPGAGRLTRPIQPVPVPGASSAAPDLPGYSQPRLRDASLLCDAPSFSQKGA